MEADGAHAAYAVHRLAYVGRAVEIQQREAVPELVRNDRLNVVPPRSVGGRPCPHVVEHDVVLKHRPGRSVVPPVVGSERSAGAPPADLVQIVVRVARSGAGTAVAEGVGRPAGRVPLLKASHYGGQGRFGRLIGAVGIDEHVLAHRLGGLPPAGARRVRHCELLADSGVSRDYDVDRAAARPLRHLADDH